MIWTTWRQHRAEAGVAALLLACLTAAMLVVGNIARDRAQALGLPTCRSNQGDCNQALSRLHDDFHSIPPFTFVFIALPVVAGMFLAAPLVSREYEAGTHRLAWTQSISPLRWITTKIVVIFAAVAAAALAVGLFVDWTLDPLTAAFGGRYNSSWFDIQGIVPVACALFALAVGVAASALIRRTIPAMAVTLVAYVAARVPMHWIRWHFAPLTTRTITVPLTTLLDNVTSSPREYATAPLPSGAWYHGLSVIDPSGRAIPADEASFSILQRYCSNLQVNPARDGVLNPRSCAQRVQNLSLHETISYQPTSHFWLIQAVESAVFLGLAGVIAAVAILAVARRPPT